MNDEPTKIPRDFDPYAKEQDLRSESGSWDTSWIEDARPGDIPVIDLADYFDCGSDAALCDVADRLRAACEETGFFSIVGHRVDPALVDGIFAAARALHALPLETRNALSMDRPDWPVGGVGYLPLNNRKLPARDRGNLNEAFIVKCDHRIGLGDNQWPDAAALPGFRASVEAYAGALLNLGKRMLPIYATALDMPPNFFAPAFERPHYRLRMTHYPPQPADNDDGFGIAPHVDTTFCTILAQDRPGLVIFSERRRQWIRAPRLDNAFIVNSGELLKLWTNDRFISVKHFASNEADGESRYSIPLFLNANSDYRMHCIPSCCSADNPPRYPPISYAESQAVAQGE